MPHQGSRTTVLGNVTPRAEVQKAREIEHDGGQKRERPQDRRQTNGGFEKGRPIPESNRVKRSVRQEHLLVFFWKKFAAIGSLLLASSWWKSASLWQGGF